MPDSFNMTNYEQTFAEFQWEVPESYNFARDVIDRWALDPDRLALWWVDDYGNEDKKTFRELSDASQRLCNVLREQGIGKGDVVVVILPRLVEWWVINIACLRMGAVISPGTMQLTAKDIRFRLQMADARCIITTDAIAERVDEIYGECPTLQSRILIGGERAGWLRYHEAMATASDSFPTVDTAADDSAILYFTSGTTGYPKMTLHTHTSYPIGHTVTGRYWLDLRSEDLHWNLSDTGWAKAAWSSFFGPWICGAAIFVHHSDRFDPKRTLELLDQYPITTFCGAPTIYRMLVLEDLKQYRFSRLRHCVGAGEPLNPEVIDIWKEATGLTIRDGYGQTESVLLVGSFPCLEPRIGSMGKPAPGFDVQVIDDEGNILPPNKEGDIAVRVKPKRPVGLFKEYWRDPEKTASVFRGDWYLTGDRAYRDEDGYFWFVGRADDVILSAGYRIGPFEVESALLEHEAVAESAVVSSPDEIRGEVVKAFVVLRPGFMPSDDLADELKEHVKKVTAPYKYPRLIEFTPSLPKTVSGKIRRVELRNREWQDHRKA
ncbi:acetyl-coenzyme a synthetase family protein, putative [Heliomicrobium modesticaldum Ice1]|uniref:Acetyl-coenzyme a synthetase family protein, putative n=2 Tax=Heliomicrobium modesticaldum TaxID=35701 RepID=B0TAL5_HELMI|nr:acetyl-coenzyme a synthetase family protein, putative [Heliomicrobium modesticaldum Ice1]